MRTKLLEIVGTFVMVTLFILGVNTIVSAQGRGHGGGGGKGSGMGQPGGAGVDRGLERSSDVSSGRDNGRSIASDRSKGRSDSGLDRARMASENLNNANKDLTKHPGIASTLHTNANA